MRAFRISLAILNLALIGCGTLSDEFCGPVNDDLFYRGVRWDLQVAKQGAKENSPQVLMALDVPFSAVADSVLAPFLVAVWLDPSYKPISVILNQMDENKANGPPSKQAAATTPHVDSPPSTTPRTGRRDIPE